MSLTLYVDGPRWRRHLAHVRGELPGLVPVVKANGYGFGRSLLAAECADLGVETVAVGEQHEVASIRPAYDRDVLVLAPYFPNAPADVNVRDTDDDRLVRTVSTADGLRSPALRGTRVIVELLSSVRRFGLREAELTGLPEALRDVRCEGFALHLPIDAEPGTRLAEARRALARIRAAGAVPEALWLSHLSPSELAELSAAEPDVRMRPRVGTSLWLGDPGAAQARATILASHAVRRGQRYGYHQRRAVRDGTLLVVSGGTSQGIALAAPSASKDLGGRARAAAIGGLDAAGRALSPFTVDGRKRWFAETPHMQVSMVWLPKGARVPEVGAEVPVEVRMTTVVFDRVVLTA